MKIKLLCIGKTDDKKLSELISVYAKRLGFYINFELETIPDLKKAKNLSQEQQKIKEGGTDPQHFAAPGSFDFA